MTSLCFEPSWCNLCLFQTDHHSVLTVSKLIHICLELQGPVKSILLVLEYMDGEGSVEPATTELKVGAIRTAQFASKKVKKIKSAALCQTLQGVLTE